MAKSIEECNREIKYWTEELTKVQKELRWWTEELQNAIRENRDNQSEK